MSLKYVDFSILELHTKTKKKHNCSRTHLVIISHNFLDNFVVEIAFIYKKDKKASKKTSAPQES